ncbi:MAG: prepilin peptidase [Bdellovibrio sp. 28-41-41]|nr:MAG: prepilin peptidase [Bdellovibrio sp. 28-41-41]
MINDILQLPTEVQYFFFFLVGSILGSFANVVIYRLPEDLSVIRPGSHCYQCKKPVRWYDNIPILTWFILKGRCRNCGVAFSWRYPFVEFLTGLLFVLSFHFIGYKWFLLEVLIFQFGIVVCSFIDFDHMILPDEYTLSGIVIGLLGAWLNPERQFLEAFLGVLFGGGFLWFMAYAYYLLSKNEGMGGGDIKLLGWMGALLGWKAIPFVIMTSAILGSVIGIAIAVKNKDGLKTAIPFGPYLAFGGVLYIFGGNEWAIQYFNLFLPGF